MADTLCWAPWSSINITNFGEYRPCCVMQNNIKGFTDKNGHSYSVNEIGNLERFVSSKQVTSLRESMIKGEWNPLCKRCELREKIGVVSQRNDYNNMLADKNFPTGFRLKHMDLNFGNKCNLKCRMCYPSTSHLLAKEWPKLDIDDNRPYLKEYETPFKINIDAIKNMIESYSDDLEIIKMAGGEALANDEHDEIISWLVDKNYCKNIILSYNTNGTILTDELLDYWSKFKRVILSISIDAIGDLNTYIRYPTSWSVIEKNMNTLDKFIENKNITVAISTTVQALNVTRLHEILVWSKKFKNIKKLPYMKIVTHPETFDPRVIPKDLRIESSKLLMEELVKNPIKHPDFDRICKISSMMKNSEHLNERFLKFLEVNRKFDKVRKTDLLKILPELIPYVNSTS